MAFDSLAAHRLAEKSLEARLPGGFQKDDHLSKLAERALDVSLATSWQGHNRAAVLTGDAKGVAATLLMP